MCVCTIFAALSQASAQHAPRHTAILLIGPGAFGLIDGGHIRLTQHIPRLADILRIAPAGHLAPRPVFDGLILLGQSDRLFAIVQFQRAVQLQQRVVVVDVLHTELRVYNDLGDFHHITTVRVRRRANAH